MRTQFTFYQSFYRAAARIRDPAERCAYYDALLGYALDGIEPELDSLPDAVAVAIELVKPTLDTSRRKAEAGQKGGASKLKANASNVESNASKAEAKPKQAQAKPKLDIDIDIDRDIDIDIGVISSKGTEPDKSAAVLALPLNDGTEHVVSEADVQRYMELYPAVDIFAELRKMKGWLLANPSRRKTKRGIARFIASWLAKEQDRGGARRGSGGYHADAQGGTAKAAQYNVHYDVE